MNSGAGEGHAGDRAEADQRVGDVPDGDEREHRRGDEALVERAHDRLVAASRTKKVPMIEVMMQAPPMASG